MRNTKTGWPSFARKNKGEALTEDSGDHLLISEVLEHVLLQHYFLLKMRKAIGESVNEFWEGLDTYTTYQLLEWVYQIIETEEDMRNNPEKYKNGSPSQSQVEEDPETLDFYNQMRSGGS